MELLVFDLPSESTMVIAPVAYGNPMSESRTWKLIEFAEVNEDWTKIGAGGPFARLGFVAKRCSNSKAFTFVSGPVVFASIAITLPESSRAAIYEKVTASI